MYDTTTVLGPQLVTGKPSRYAEPLGARISHGAAFAADKCAESEVWVVEMLLSVIWRHS